MQRKAALCPNQGRIGGGGGVHRDKKKHKSDSERNVECINKMSDSEILTPQTAESLNAAWILPGLLMDNKRAPLLTDARQLAPEEDRAHCSEPHDRRSDPRNGIKTF